MLVERGQVDAAQAILAASSVEDAIGGELLLSTRSNLQAARGDLGSALADQLEARRLNGAEEPPDPDFDGWLRIARLLHATGDAPAAAREAEAALRRRGERKAAREPLRRALDLASAGGLVATAERAREELRVTGAKIHRPEAPGRDSLTPSERRIVELATDGASNPEIAQAMFVTVKTVEMHLGNAYRKLGINSRRDLAALLAPEKPQGASTGTTP